MESSVQGIRPRQVSTETIRDVGYSLFRILEHLQSKLHGAPAMLKGDFPAMLKGDFNASLWNVYITNRYGRTRMLLADTDQQAVPNHSPLICENR